MNPTLTQRLLGANSKVRLFVLLLAASYAILRFPQILDGFSPDLKQAIFFVANESWHIAIAAALWFVKQNNVSGNGTLDNPTQVKQSDGTNKVVSPIIVALLIPALALSGCVTDAVTGKKRLATAAEISADVEAFQSNPKVQAVERAAAVAVVNGLFSAATNEMNGGKFDSTWTMAAAFNSISAAVRTLPASEAGNLIVNTAQNFTKDPSTKPLAQKLAKAYVDANPQTPAEKSATVVALATGTQTGTEIAATVLP